MIFMARIGGNRRKKVSILTKSTREKGKVSISKYMSEYKAGEKVSLNIEPSEHKGMFHPRFSGKTGTIINKVGSCYEVKIKDFTKEKVITVHPIHLKRL